jgi:hypothetical protein
MKMEISKRKIKPTKGFIQIIKKYFSLKNSYTILFSAHQKMV